MTKKRGTKNKKKTLEELAREMNEAVAQYLDDKFKYGPDAAMEMASLFAAQRATKRFLNAAKRVK